MPALYPEECSPASQGDRLLALPTEDQNQLLCHVDMTAACLLPAAGHQSPTVLQPVFPSTSSLPHIYSPPVLSRPGILQPTRLLDSLEPLKGPADGRSPSPATRRGWPTDAEMAGVRPLALRLLLQVSLLLLFDRPRNGVL